MKFGPRKICSVDSTSGAIGIRAVLQSITWSQRLRGSPRIPGTYPWPGVHT